MDGELDSFQFSLGYGKPLAPVPSSSSSASSSLSILPKRAMDEAAAAGGSSSGSSSSSGNNRGMLGSNRGRASDSLGNTTEPAAGAGAGAGANSLYAPKRRTVKQASSLPAYCLLEPTGPEHKASAAAAAAVASGNGALTRVRNDPRLRGPSSASTYQFLLATVNNTYGGDRSNASPVAGVGAAGIAGSPIPSLSVSTTASKRR